MLINDLKELKEELCIRAVCNTDIVIAIVDRMIEELEGRDFQKRENLKERLYKLREEYFIIAWTRPYMWRPEGTLEIKIAEVKNNNLIKWNSLDSKKSEWKKR